MDTILTILEEMREVCTHIDKNEYDSFAKTSKE